jgi:CRP-like cAMP-binding protein
MRGFSAADAAQALSEIASPGRRLSAGDRVVREGSKADSLFVLLDGLATAHRTLQGGQQIVAIYIPGDFLNLAAYVSDTPNACVQVRGRASVGQISRQRLDPLLDASPTLARWLLVELASTSVMLQE